jgi:ferritin
MLSPKVNKALNAQIRLELFSGYSYLAMANYCDSQELLGFAKWFQVQAHEELGHAMKFIDFVNDAGGKVELLPIEAPKNEFKSYADTFKAGLEHEKRVTSEINKLRDLALAEKDHATAVMLEWFVTEQVEEEKNFMNAIAKVDAAGCQSGLVFLDHHFGKRGEGK